MTASAPQAERRLRRSRGVIRWTVVFVLLAELVTRLIAGRLPEPLRWYSIEAQTKVAQMEQLRREGWKGGVVFIGTSMMNVALDPLELARSVGQETTFAYNASLSAGIPRLMEEWTKAVVFPKLQPSVLVIGLSSIDLNDASSHRELLLRLFEAAPAARLALGRASLMERIDDAASRVSAFVRYRRAFRDPKRVFQSVVLNRSAVVDPQVGSFGAGLAHRGEDFALPKPVDRAEGTLADYHTGGLEQAAIGRIIALAQARGTRVLIVKMPVTAEYIATHPRGGDDYQVFERALAALAASYAVPVIDAQPAATGHRYFADDSHLNGRGTEAFTHLIATELETRGLVAAPDTPPTPPTTPQPKPTVPVVPTPTVPIPTTPPAPTTPPIPTPTPGVPTPRTGLPGPPGVSTPSAG